MKNKVKQLTLQELLKECGGGVILWQLDNGTCCAVKTENAQKEGAISETYVDIDSLYYGEKKGTGKTFNEAVSNLLLTIY